MLRAKIRPGMEERFEQAWLAIGRGVTDLCRAKTEPPTKSEATKPIESLGVRHPRS
jgi:hypothetical protein